ncbi:LOB domain-containing protein 12-like [Vicia villosa]|uniref:LOB domain-containing protein 12-like n=1 Tax=Vicia villosa TaxID=3911 RepID=UPI00273A7E70|nr:LOB domain-containing protein 12-like [Vicia villosa]
MNTIKSNKACAACTHQRKKCLKDCLLAPYFPAHKPKMFHNAHSLYGVSNMVRILNELPKEKRDLAMRTLIYESNVRKIYPIGGCVDVIKDYCDKLSEALEELNQVKKVLDYCKVNHLQSQNLSSSLPSTTSTNSDISNIPIFNNVGNVTNYYNNNENNIETMMNASPSHWSDIIPRDVNNTPTNTNWNINSMDASRFAQLSEGVFNNRESDLGGGVDISTEEWLKEIEKKFNDEDYLIPDSEIDRIYNGDEQAFVEKDSSQRLVER